MRTHLKLDAYALSEETMRSVWVALDSDGSGYLSAGEFGRFMRKGEEGVGSVATTWRQNLHAKLQREREEFEAVLYKEARRNAHIEPAEESEVNEMAVKLTKKMHQVFVAQNPSWYIPDSNRRLTHAAPQLTPLLPLQVHRGDVQRLRRRRAARRR